jgi:tRNA nucleotidyltransferase (CCA-adding enzyme)
MTIKYYQVGGHVRDRLMGLRSKDLDYAVEAPDYATMLAWIESQGKVYLAQEQFWTVRAHLPNKPPADFVLCRMDGQYSDGRRPDTVNVGTLADDLARRDFTVNAIAYHEETDTYIDPHGGQEDIKLKLLRCVGNPLNRFSEDALRILRAIRFCITKGFTMHDSVREALTMSKLTQKLKDNVSTERKMDELLKCFTHNTPMTLDYLQKYPTITEACFSGPLWLMPTMRQ